MLYFIVALLPCSALFCPVAWLLCGCYFHEMAKLTKREIDALAASGNAPAYLWDQAVAGFGVKAMPSGVKRFILKYRSDGGGRSAKQRWLTIGTYGALTLDQARDIARQAAAEIARGGDPQAKKTLLRAAPKVSDAWARFETEVLPDKKPLTQRDYKAIWTDLLSPRFGSTKVETLSRSDIDRFHKALRETPYRANRALALLSRLMSLAEAWEWRAQGTNPCKHVTRFEEKSRTRYLAPAELKRLGVSLPALAADRTITQSARNAIELLLLTGARLNEILGAKWRWVNLKHGILSLPDSKTGAKPIYLSDQAKAVIRRQKAISRRATYIFPSATDPKKPFVNLRKPWQRVCSHAKIKNVRLHDLRHTAASIAVSQGASLPVIGRLLGHTQAQTTQRYAHVDADPALKAANEIGSFISTAFASKKSRTRTKTTKRQTSSVIEII